MKEIIKSIEIALENKNWYVALFSCLCVPDICGRIDSPNEGSEKRYVIWFNKYVRKNYVRPKVPSLPQMPKELIEIMDQPFFLRGDDCYALRCAYLHEGRDIIKDQRIIQKMGKIFEDFKFTIPSNGTGRSHCNWINGTLQLRIDKFCKDILNGVKECLEEIEKDSSKENQLKDLMKLYYSFSFLNN